MKKIAIFRQERVEGPGYLADFFDVREIPWRLIRLDAGDSLPTSVAEFSGLVIMGGPMSVNDNTPWIPPLLSLIRDAVAKDIAVLGHCLGGQLMSIALGGSVCHNPVKEIGWGELMVTENAEARYWFGDVKQFLGFHWHGETFSVPPGASHLLSSAYCDNQGFAMGKHLGLQCHIEMTEPMIKAWCANGTTEIASAHRSPGVQQAQVICNRMTEKVRTLNLIAEAVYSRWIASLHN